VIVLPAIDVRAGRCVRLQQGRPDREIVFSDDPVAVAGRWAAEGAQWLHVVNLDAALWAGGEDATGSRDAVRAAATLQAVASIAESVRVFVQLGGGLRDMPSIEAAFELGVARVVLGTAAVAQPQLVAQAIERFGAERVAVGIDVRDGRVAVRGWQDVSPLSALALADRVQALGARWVVATDIARDGMLLGPNLTALRQLAGTGCHVIASGGVSSLADLRALAGIPGVEGAIVGMALYTGAIGLREALALCLPRESSPVST
jgi:phosphoribosylformimino-5-aminoimidazole carboxamide ribotide isomerase